MSGWFKHKMDAGDDPFIIALMKQYGFKGYWVFFRTLELMRQNFNVKKVGTLHEDDLYFARKLQVQTKTVKNIYNFIHERKKFLVEYGDGKIFVHCPNFKEYMDKYARRLLLEEVGTKVGTKVGIGVPTKCPIEEKRRDIKDVSNSGSQASKGGPLASLVRRSFKKLIGGRGE